MARVDLAGYHPSTIHDPPFKFTCNMAHAPQISFLLADERHTKVAHFDSHCQRSVHSSHFICILASSSLIRDAKTNLSACKTKEMESNGANRPRQIEHEHTAIKNGRVDKRQKNKCNYRASPSYTIYMTSSLYGLLN